MNAANAYSLDQLQNIGDVIRAIDAWPAELQAFEFHHEIFGSWSLIVRRYGQRTRFTYEGKEGYLTASRLQPEPGDFSRPPQGLASIGLHRGITNDSLSKVLAFIELHTQAGPHAG